MSGRFGGVCPTCHFGPVMHGGHCPNSGKPESEWTTHEERAAARRPPDSIDAAWAAAEAALGFGNDPDAYVEMVNRTARDDAERWAAHATTPLGGWVAFGPTPAAALRALAERLRERAG